MTEPDIFETGRQVLNVSPAHRWTNILHVACQDGDVAKVRRLFKKPADIASLQDAIIIAIRYGHVDCFDELMQHVEIIDHAADIGDAIGTWNRPEFLSRVDLIKNSLVLDKLLLAAAKSGHLFLLQQIGRYPIQWWNRQVIVRNAAFHGHIDIIEWILTDFPEPMQVDALGRAFQCAVCRGHDAIAHLLLDVIEKHADCRANFNTGYIINAYITNNRRLIDRLESMLHFDPTSYRMTGAIAAGDLEEVKELAKRGSYTYQQAQSLFYAALKYYRVSVADFWYQRGNFLYWQIIYEYDLFLQRLSDAQDIGRQLQTVQWMYDLLDKHPDRLAYENDLTYETYYMRRHLLQQTVEGVCINGEVFLLEWCATLPGLCTVLYDHRWVAKVIQAENVAGVEFVFTHFGPQIGNLYWVEPTYILPLLELGAPVRWFTEKRQQPAIKQATWMRKQKNMYIENLLQRHVFSTIVRCVVACYVPWI
jgi:hypothetical protein